MYLLFLCDSEPCEKPVKGFLPFKIFIRTGIFKYLSFKRIPINLDLLNGSAKNSKNISFYHD